MSSFAPLIFIHLTSSSHGAAPGRTEPWSYQTFTTPESWEYCTFGKALDAVGDMNGDGIIDIAISDSVATTDDRLGGQVYLLYGAESGVFDG